MRFIGFNDWLNESISDNITILFPGGFKPITGAHIDLIKRYLAHPNVKEVKVLIGPGIRNGIGQELALKIAKELLQPFDRVSIEAVNYPSPILASYKYMETAEPGTYALAASKKSNGEDYKRVLKFVKDFQPDGKYVKTLPNDVKAIELSVDAEPLIYKGRTDEFDRMPISASILRRDVLNNDYENFKTNYPGYSEKDIKKIWNLLKLNVTEE